MQLSKAEMDQKLETTAEKTIEAIGRTQRFIVKYGPDLKENQLKRIADKLKELQKSL